MGRAWASEPSILLPQVMSFASAVMTGGVVAIPPPEPPRFAGHVAEEGLVTVG